MSVITVSLSETGEKLLRELAREEYHSRKGALSKVIEESLVELARKKRSEAAKERALKQMREGFDLGGGPYYKNRSELYDDE